VSEQALTQETTMLSTQEPFLSSELEFRRNQIRDQFAASAQRKARRARRLPAARRAAGILSGRLATGS